MGDWSRKELTTVIQTFGIAGLANHHELLWVAGPSSRSAVEQHMCPARAPPWLLKNTLEPIGPWYSCGPPIEHRRVSK